MLLLQHLSHQQPLLSILTKFPSHHCGNYGIIFKRPQPCLQPITPKHSTTSLLSTHLLFFPLFGAGSRWAKVYFYKLIQFFMLCSRAGSTKALVVKYMFWEEIQDPPYWNSSMLIIFPLLMEESFNGSTEMNPTLMTKLEDYLVNYPKVLLFL
jgi:hypothetical protein